MQQTKTQIIHDYKLAKAQLFEASLNFCETPNKDNYQKLQESHKAFKEVLDKMKGN